MVAKGTAGLVCADLVDLVAKVGGVALERVVELV